MNRRLIQTLGVVLAAAVSWGTAAQEPDGPTAAALAPSDIQSLPKSISGDVSVIVKFDADSMAAYAGGLAGLDATNPQVTGARRLDLRSARSRAYETFLAGKEDAFENAVRRRIPRARIVHRFRSIIGGVSVVLPSDRVKELYGMPGVAAVYPDLLLPLSTDRSPEFIGAPALWDKVGGQGMAGEGVIVGIIDSGIWPEHPSVADTGYPVPPAEWTGTACEFGSATPADVAFPCNNKLIGARRQMTTFDIFGGGAGTPLAGEFLSARDNNGHGSHTATTAVGNAGVIATTGSTVSGVAPRAHLAVYKVCFTVPVTGQGSCYTSDSAAAIQQGIADGVDVMNFSIGGGSNPYSDAVSLAFLDAYSAGVFVAAAGGNAGPGADTVSHRAPWVTTAAATTTDKGFAGSAALSAGDGSTLALTGISSTADLATPSPVVLSATATGYADALCLAPAPAGSLTGSIVACKRGINARVSKSFNVAAGGAVGMILYNDPALPPASLNADVHAVPSLHINETQGAALEAFLTAHADATGTITGGADDLSGVGDVVASFSSRGGSNQTLGISKPDVAAPGVNILAANTPSLAEPSLPQGQLYQIISGTSMASPHVAGAGALLRQLHPDWTPGQIQSALMMTATTESTVKEDGVTPTTPYDVGSGRIDLTRAGKPGLTISETADNYLLLAGNLSTANYPSLYIPVLAGKAAVQRTLKSVDSRTRAWKLHVEAPDDVNVSVPHTVVLRSGREKTITIYVDASGVPLGETRHAALHLTSHDGDGDDDDCRDHDRHRGRHGHGSHEQDIELTFPITVVRKQGAVTLDKTCDPLVLAKGAATTCTIQFTNTTFDNQTPLVLDIVPRELDVTSVTGASRFGNAVFFFGNLGPASPPDVSLAAGTAPFGYLPLRLLGVPKQTGFGDETIGNFTLAAGTSYIYAGNTYNRVGITSNGYLVVGGGTAADVQFINQSLPDAAVPNNVLAPFWSDLNLATSHIPAASTAGLRVATLTSAGQRWFVVDYDRVPNFGVPSAMNSFQVWIGLNGVEDITFAYGDTTPGADGLLTVGAENFLGNRGQNYYFNGTGTALTNTTQLRVTGTPALPGETKTITINAKGAKVGTWRNCAEMSTSAVFGVATSCVEGEVTKR